MDTKTARFTAVLAGALLGAAPVIGEAQKFPVRPIRFLVPFAPGGATDITARVIAPGLGERLGQQVVVDNRPGAGSIIGTQILAGAVPDGHTIMLAEIAFGANPALHSKLPYDTRKDFAPVILVALMPTILVVPPSLPVKSVADLIALAKSKQRLNAEIQRVLEIPEVRERIGNLGAEIVSGPPEVLAKYIDSELKRWSAAIKPHMRVK